jgi:hypothetical protein
LVFPVFMYTIISVLQCFPMSNLTTITNIFNAMKCSQAIRCIRRGKISNISDYLGLHQQGLMRWVKKLHYTLNPIQHIQARQTPLHSNIFSISDTSKSAKNVTLTCDLSACLCTPVSTDFPLLSYTGAHKI